MWNKLFENNEHSSSLPSMKQITPSERSTVGNDGIGSREFGKTPESGQSKIWGNLNSQSRGMEGNLDTQGKSAPEMFTSNNCCAKGTKSSSYDSLKDKKVMAESANEKNTGVEAGKLKTTGAEGVSTGLKNKYIPGADTASNDNKTITEAQKIGSMLSMAAIQVFNESAQIKRIKKNKK